MGMGTRMGMYDSIPKVQDWEGDEIDPFPKLGNEKEMKRIILSRFLCESRLSIGKFDYGKGIK